MCVLPPPPSSSFSITPSPLSTGSIKNSSFSVLIMPAWKKKMDNIKIKWPLKRDKRCQQLVYYAWLSSYIVHLSNPLQTEIALWLILLLCLGHAGKKEKRRKGGDAFWVPCGGPEWHLASKMTSTQERDETVALPSSANTSCQVIPPFFFFAFHTHISCAQTHMKLVKGGAT